MFKTADSYLTENAEIKTPNTFFDAIYFITSPFVSHILPLVKSLAIKLNITNWTYFSLSVLISLRACRLIPI